jgi:hypothetical protein
MDQNPFETPKFSPPVREVEHRSFRLTRAEGEPLFADLASVSDLRKAVLVALIQQLPLLAISAMLLDGGRVCDLVIKSMGLFWAGYVLTLLLVHVKKNGTDAWLILYLWLAFLPILICLMSILG